MVLDRADAEDNAPAAVFALDGLARLAATAGDDDRARRLSDRAEQRMSDASHFITDRDRVDVVVPRTT